MSIESYFDKVQPHLVQLIKEKQTNKQKLQIDIGVKFIYPVTKKQFVCYIHTDNLKVISTDDEYTVLNELFHNFLIKYQEKYILLDKEADLNTMVLKIYLLDLEKLTQIDDLHTFNLQNG